MRDKDNTLLIITGPTTSVGKTGSTFASPVPDRVNFDCSENVARLTSTCPFPQAVLVTWENDSLVHPLETLRMQDRDVPEGRGWAANKYRQSFLIAEGARYAKKLGYAYVVRVRTDQFIDLNKLADNDWKAAREGKLVVMPPLVGGPWLPDFFFLGRAEILESLFLAHLTKAELSADTHEDLFRRWAVENGISASSLFPFLGQALSKAQVEVARSVWAHHLHTISPSAMRGFTWRGAPLNYDFEDHDPTWEPPLYGGREWVQWLIPDRVVSKVWTNWFLATGVDRPLIEKNIIRRFRRQVGYILNKACEVVILRFVAFRDNLQRMFCK